MPDLSATQVLNFFGLQNYQIQNVPPPQASDPYTGKLPVPVALPDKGLYQSPLTTPVMSDITLGDQVRTINNSWTDFNGKTRSFTPVRHATVIITVAQTKNIVRTQIQGRDSGTVKEYIGMGDYEIDIKGIICGSNGVFPKDDTTNLKAVLDAPIPIVVTSWYLQMLGIYSIVVDSYEIGQTEGGYSLQPFNIKASSDTPVELKII